MASPSSFGHKRFLFMTFHGFFNGRELGLLMGFGTGIGSIMIGCSETLELCTS